MDNPNKEAWKDFWTRNPDIFLEQMLGVELKWYQKIVLRAMQLKRKLRSIKTIL